jgi:uncharacterized protein YbjT (DUF2867 family)
MKVTVTGSLGNISRVLVEKLIANGHEVKVISSNAERASAIEKLKATPLIGSLADATFVSQAFKDADAVYTMVPPDFSVPDYLNFADTIHRNYAQAIQQNNIQYAVNLSSIGVAVAGVPPLTRYYDLEKRLNEVPGLNVVHLRPAMFYTNFYGGLPMIKHQGIMGHNLNETVDLPMTHPADIADMAFTFLQARHFTGSQIKYVISDIRNGNEITKLVGDAINKPVQWVAFPDDGLLAGLLQNGFSKDAAETLVVAAGKAIREGLFNEFKKDEYIMPAGRKFADFAKEFAMAYHYSN